jgi:hypothetical protein
MEPAAIFLLLILLAIIVFFVTRPFFKRQQARPDEGNTGLSSLLAERERLLTALQELDFDQTLGKIPAEDYPSQRAALVKKGAEVLRQLDAIKPGLGKSNQGKVTKGTDEIKQALPLSDDDLEDILSKRRNIRKDKTAGFCPTCGKPVLVSDIFCPSCGSTLKSASGPQ